ncbi:unnamed protein product [Rotaria sordida]|uniref:Uncharacterized protein n=1 Tax=Rotaria sordida TaxID=392033 RepID=A0A813VJ86_9BILA|nr:unnamed protein product [Rotaria sordida]
MVMFNELVLQKIIIAIRDDEYVIYNLDQQRLLYLVELSWIPYDNMNQSLKLLPIIRDYLTNQSKLLSDEGNQFFFQTNHR